MLISEKNAVNPAVLATWIACLWIDACAAAADAAPAGVENAEPQPESSDLNAQN